MKEKKNSKEMLSVHPDGQLSNQEIVTVAQSQTPLEKSKTGTLKLGEK